MSIISSLRMRYRNLNFLFLFHVYMFSSKIFYSSRCLFFKKENKIQRKQESNMLITHAQFLKDTHLLDYELL